MNNLKIVIAGGTGFIGQSLCRYLALNNKVVVLSRSLKSPANNTYGKFDSVMKDFENVRTVQWNGKDLGEWQKEIDGADVVINLAGKSVNCRYNKKNRKEIFKSRVFSAKA